VEMIKEKYPSHEIIGEESASENIVLSKKPTWVIDPIDGTTNFISQFPYCATLIGFMVDRVPVVGVAFNPILDELYAARKGNGATKNGEKITVNDTKEISKSLIITEFGSSRDEKIIDIVLQNMKSTILTPSRGIRALGACGPNVCCVASGQADLLYETGMHIWDICAVSIILEEAGGVVMNADGSTPLNYLNRKYIASCTPELAKEVASKLKPIDVPADGIESQD